MTNRNVIIKLHHTSYPFDKHFRTIYIAKKYCQNTFRLSVEIQKIIILRILGSCCDAPSRLEMALHCNVIFHMLGTSTEISVNNITRDDNAIVVVFDKTYHYQGARGWKWKCLDAEIHRIDFNWNDHPLTSSKMLNISQNMISICSCRWNVWTTKYISNPWQTV